MSDAGRTVPPSGISAEPAGLERALGAAEEALRDGAGARAAALLPSAAALAGAAPALRLLGARLHFRAGALDAAEALARALVEDDGADRRERATAALLLGRVAGARNDWPEAARRYAAAVDRMPGSERAWNFLALATMRAHPGDPDGAIAALAQVSDRHPGAAFAPVVQAQLLLQASRPGAAERCLAAVAADRSPRTVALRARAARLQGRVEEAERLLAAASTEPGAESADLLLERGLVADAKGDRAGALAAAEALLAQRPRSADALELKARQLVLSSRLPDLEAHARAWLAIDPRSRAARRHLALSLYETGRAEEALALVEGLIAERPDDGQFHAMRAVVLKELGRLPPALKAARQAVALAPDHASGHVAMADALLALNRIDESEAAARAALDRHPGLPEALTILATTLLRQDRHEEAEAVARDGLRVAPDNPYVMAFFGTLHWMRAEHEDAIRLFRAALEKRPEHAEIHYNLSLALFGQGALAEGWGHFAWRWRTAGARRRPHDDPPWTGGRHDGPLVLWAEQGIGDEVLGLGLAGEAATLAGPVLVECDPRLVPVVARSIPTVRAVPRRDPPDPTLRGLANARQCPLLDLPALLRPSVASFPEHGGYLRADPARVAALRTRYRGLGSSRDGDGRGDGPNRPPLLVGVSWRSVNPRFGRLKSTPLTEWGPILSQPGPVFVNLQYGDCAGDLAAVRERLGVKVVQDEAIDPLADLDAFSAQVAAMDLVITVSNSTAHFAGALGRPTWLLLSQGGGQLWYWELGREQRSLWYPSVRILRQPSSRAWTPVIKRAGAMLGDLVGGTVRTG